MLCSRTKIKRPAQRSYQTEVRPAAKSALEKEAALPHHLRERVRKRDHVLKGSTPSAVIAVINNTHMTETARKKHSLSSTTTRLLGRAMAGVALVSSLHKGDERVHAQWHGQGSVRTVAVEAQRNGEVRGYVNPPDFYMPSNTPLGFAMKVGTLEIIKVLYGGARPYRSVIEMAGGDITSDLEAYFKTSEQTPTLFDLETYLNADGSVKFSGGVMVQAMPPEDAKDTKFADRVIDEYRERMKNLPPLSTLFMEDANHLRDVLAKIAQVAIAPELLTKIATDFHCRCSKDKFKMKLLTLGKVDLKDYYDLARKEPEKSGMKCVYCSSTYHLNQDDLAELLQRIESTPAASQPKSTQGPQDVK